MMTANTGQAQAVLRSNLTQIAQLKEPVTSQHEMKKGLLKTKCYMKSKNFVCKWPLSKL